ncbi:MAG: sensor domain-containing diguanylate cyclase [Elusimicrobiota bacterium]
MENINEVNFIKSILSKLAENCGIKNITVFEYSQRLSILKAVLRLRLDIVFEHTEYVWVKESKEFYDAILSGLNYPVKVGKCVFVYIPYVFKSQISETGERRFIFRVERFDGKKYSGRELAKIKDQIASQMFEYYKVDFEILRETYYRNLNISTSLGKIFAKSIREKEGFKFMMRGLENFFSFDRIRLYRVDETKNTLCGVYSIDRTMKINDISHDVISFKSGNSTLVDILMSGEDVVVKEYLVYLPLKIDYNKIGIIVVDNLLSRLPIREYYIDLLKSFSSLIALAMENIVLFEKIQEMSLYDELTKLPIRRYFNQRFQEEFYRAVRFNQSLSLIWIDIDYFKEINDSFGHQVGDAVLREVSKCIIRTIRKIDFPCRYGGDEIVILLPQSSKEHALGLAKRLSDEIKKIRVDLSGFEINKSLQITTSMGIASYPDDAKNMEDLLSNSDEALYWVKSHGRNGIKSYSEIIEDQNQK